MDPSQPVWEPAPRPESRPPVDSFRPAVPPPPSSPPPAPSPTPPLGAAPSAGQDLSHLPPPTGLPTQLPAPHVDAPAPAGTAPVPSGGSSSSSGIDPKWLAAGAGVVALGVLALGVMTVGLGLDPVTALVLVGAWCGRMGMFIHRRANGRHSLGGGRGQAHVIRLLVGLVVGGMIVSRVAFGGASPSAYDVGVASFEPSPIGAPTAGQGDGFCVPDVQPPDPDC